MEFKFFTYIYSFSMDWYYDFKEILNSRLRLKQRVKYWELRYINDLQFVLLY